MRKTKNKFKYLEAVVYNPEPTIYWLPLKPGEVVYYMGEIPNVPGHCIVCRDNGQVVPMIHPEDLRKAKDEEL